MLPVRLCCSDILRKKLATVSLFVVDSKEKNKLPFVRAPITVVFCFYCFDIGSLNFWPLTYHNLGALSHRFVVVSSIHHIRTPLLCIPISLLINSILSCLSSFSLSLVASVVEDTGTGSGFYSIGRNSEVFDWRFEL